MKSRAVRTGVASLALLLLVQSLLAGTKPGGYKPDEAYEAIGLKSLRAHLTFLASNLLEGREATTRGYDIAADYAASLFQQYGLTPVSEVSGERSFLQIFPVAEIVGRETDSLQILTTHGDAQIVQGFANRIHFYTSFSNKTMSMSAPLVFAGYGLVEKEAGYDDFAGIDVKNKVVVMFTHAPGEGDEKSYFYKKENRNRFFNGMEVFEKRRNAQQRGALAILLVSDPLGKHPSIFGSFASNVIKKPRNNINVTTPRRRMILPDMESDDSPIPIINISDSIATAIFDKTGRNPEGLQRQINSRQQPSSFELSEKRIKINAEVETKLLNTSNVIGMIEGSDPQLKNEYVVVSAHLDHEGSREGYIWNGADDDASGSAAVIELAGVFARSKIRLRRSMLFCLWGAEEKGLLGSRYFTEHPLVPLDKISAMVQLDMIGRDVEPRPHQLKGKQKPKDLKRYVFTEISAQSPELGDIIGRANLTVGLELNQVTTTEMQGDSDHYSFWVKKIPVLSIDDGVYHEDYHQPTDTAEKINFDKVLLVSRLTYLILREISNYPSKLRWNDAIAPQEE